MALQFKWVKYIQGIRNFRDVIIIFFRILCLFTLAYIGGGGVTFCYIKEGGIDFYVVLFLI